MSFAPLLADPSLPSPRPWIYAEMYGPPGFVPHAYWRRAVRDERYKLIWTYQGSPVPTLRQFFDLDADPLETVSLLAQPLDQREDEAHMLLEEAMHDLHQSWARFGAGLAGTHGVPQLVGTGTLEPSSPVSITLQGARENSIATLAAGVSLLGAPFKGGLFELAPHVFVPGLPTGPDGSLLLTSSWPPALPPQTYFYYQAWIADPAGPVGYSATPALVSITR